MLISEPQEDIPPRVDDRTSELLRRLLTEIEDDTVTVGYLSAQLRRRSFGGILIALALVALLPGVSLFAGLAMLIPAFQMALGLRAPALPGFVARRKIPVSALRAHADRAIPWIEKLEVYVRPRWIMLSRPPVPMLIGLLSFVLALVIMLPLPLGNVPPAIAVLVLALGLVEKDGLLILVGLVLTAVAFALGAVMAAVLIEGVSALLT
ncbi:MAG: exopolysaccharide biosynthesis protein [Alphaproteobacteria bacterium]|nr:exopolysaccharide biosynthesis protein [Alphaproteobacteria bacterium]